MPTINSILQHLELITQAALAVGLVVFFLLERRKPRVLAGSGQAPRWQTNIALYVLGALLIAFGFDAFNARAIQWGGALGWGGLAAAPWPTWVKVVLGVFLMDMLQYALHVLSHHTPWWWRLHKIHHSDTRMDASTAIRHHPLEILVNGFVLVLLLAAVGMPVYAILLYAALQPLHSLFCHANIALPPVLDRWLRLLVVTPDMHATHHSIRMDEGNANFGMVFPWWDWLFRTYCKQPAQGMAALRVGIAELAQQPRAGLFSLLGLPFGAPRTGAGAANVAGERSVRRKSGRRSRR